MGTFVYLGNQNNSNWARYVLTGSQEKHRLTQNKKLQMAKGMKKKSSESLRTR